MAQVIEQGGVAVIAGIARGFGEVLAKTLSEAGYRVAGLSRSDIERDPAWDDTVYASAYRHYRCDLSEPVQVRETLSAVERDLGTPRVLIYNAMQLVVQPFLEVPAEAFESSWRSGCFGAMVTAQAVLPAMMDAGGGTLILTGATASVKGSARFGAFASSKFALRGLAQSLAREFGPQGVHVAHTLIDGVIWGPQAEKRFPVKRENCLDPRAVAELYLLLIEQKPSAWTHEIDVRPSSERF